MWLNLHAFMPLSRANGPGARAVVWVQGCSLACPQCFNPETHPFAGGERVRPHALFQRVTELGESIQGITVSGGEPLQQRPALQAFLQHVKQRTNLSTILFTGYAWEEVQGMTEANTFLACVDVLIAGRYNPKQHLAQGLRGSANKTVHHISERYTMNEFQSVPSSEAIISVNGEILISGIDPVKE